MAYVLRYELGYNSLLTTGKISIYEDDWSGGSETLILKSDSLKIKYSWGGWENPIIGLSASFSIVNEKEDFFDLMPLLTAEEREYKIIIKRITPSELTSFEGFLNCDDNEQKYLHRQEIRLNASSYLSKLQYVDPPTVEDLENDTFINIIDNCLTQTGTDDDIHVNCSLYPIGTSVDTTSTLFNKCGIYKEVFWKNNIDRDSSLDVIKKILASFDCYIMWIAGSWWIERYADIWKTSPVDYVKYTTGTKYWPGDVGSAIEVTPNVYDFVDQVKMDTTQTIKMLAGQKQVEINIEQQKLFNFIVNNFEDAAYDDTAPPEPPLRQWDIWGDTELSGAAHGYDWPIALRGEPFNNISKAINRLDYEESTVGNRSVIRGLSTRFKATITDQSIMTLKFKYGVPSNPFIWGGDPEDYEFEFRFLLRNPPGNYYLMYNYSTELWERLLEPSERGALESIYIAGSELDLALLTLEANISIPIKDAYDSGVWDGDQDFILVICAEVLWDGTPNSHFLEDVYFGDIEVTFNSPLGDNYVSGEINTNFLNKKTITQHLTDANDLGIKNGVFYGEGDTAAPEDLDIRTTIWDDAASSSGENLDLAEMKLKDKFRLYNVSRQIITADLQTTFGWRPFQRFTDSNQADSSEGEGKHFLVVGTTYMPQEDRCITQLCEYDIEEDINLV